MLVEENVEEAINVTMIHDREVILKYLEELKGDLLRDTKYLNGYVSIIGIEYLIKKERNKLLFLSRL